MIHATAAALCLDPHFPSSDPNTPTKPVFNDKKEEWLRTCVPGGLEHLLRRLHLRIEVEGDAQLGRRHVRAVIPLTQHALDTINEVESSMDVHLSEEIGLAVQSLMADPPDFDFTLPVDPSAMPKYTTSDLKLIRSCLGSVWAAIHYFNLDNPPEKSPAEIEKFDLEFRLAYFNFRRQEQEYVDGRRSGHIALAFWAPCSRASGADEGGESSSPACKDSTGEERRKNCPTEPRRSRCRRVGLASRLASATPQLHPEHLRPSARRLLLDSLFPPCRRHCSPASRWTRRPARTSKAPRGCLPRRHSPPRPRHPPPRSTPSPASSASSPSSAPASSQTHRASCGSARLAPDAGTIRRTLRAHHSRGPAGLVGGQGQVRLRAGGAGRREGATGIAHAQRR